MSLVMDETRTKAIITRIVTGSNATSLKVSPILVESVLTYLVRRRA